MGTIERRVGNMIYKLKGPQFTHKIHLNQIRKLQSDDADSGSPEEKEVTDIIYDPFDTPIPQADLEQRSLKRKRKMMDLTVVNPKGKKNWDFCEVNT